MTKRILTICATLILVLGCSLTFAACSGDDDPAKNIAVAAKLVGEWKTTEGNASYTFTPYDDVGGLCYTFVLNEVTKKDACICRVYEKGTQLTLWALGSGYEDFELKFINNNTIEIKNKDFASYSGVFKRVIAE